MARRKLRQKNILMIRADGVGKPNRFARLAKLSNAPAFIQNWSTKFTEVGYVGRDRRIHLFSWFVEMGLKMPYANKKTDKLRHKGRRPLRDRILTFYYRQLVAEIQS